ncbi:hypothetical protein B0H66DRAFT_597724 [Apodospora peruviana]|uniref:MARVEL domain-containing protein n=1 Tax=Apodospora peruviana TaxID=516989 RepID=A0AAE0IRX4_9PEZI|nr:hypothetical protein B0H66DRAFT_597724 [Apodospora peruviana]
METTSKYSTVRPAGREHIPLYPKGFVAVRILQLVFSVIILGLAAFGIWALAFSGDCFILAVAIMTLMASIYHLVSWFGAISLYNYWAVMSLDILLVVMWLSSFALLASQIAAFFAYAGGTYYDYYGYSYSHGLSSAETIVASCLAAAAGLGGVEFVLHIVSLVIHSIALHRHRAAGLHCTPGAAPSGNPSGPVYAVPGAPAGAEKVQVVYQQQTVAQPAPAYVTQPQQYAIPQQQQQQQQYYVQQTPSPLVSQPSGGTYIHQQGQVPI